MSKSFDAIMKGSQEPPLLIALHYVKAVILLAPFFLVMLFVGPLVGLGVEVWAYLLFASIVGSVVSALIANKWSESLFVRRAEAHGLDPSEAKEFYRTYDWDGTDA